MIKRLLIIVCMVSVWGCNSQTTPNYSFFKLLVTNEKKEVMLVEWDGAWEIPGQKYTGSSSIGEFVDSMAKRHGITVGEPRLSALVTFHYNNRPNPTLMHYYVTDYKSGDLKIPPSCSNIRWVPFDEAISMIPYEEMVQIMKKISSAPNKLWGASFNIQRITTNTSKSSELRENFYVLN